MNRSALISDCGKYRYILSREWDLEKGRVCWIMLNPSTADASFDDPTIRKCIGFTNRLGMGAIFVVNLCAFRATKPRDLYASDEDVIGAENESNVLQAIRRSHKVIAAWGCLNPRTAWAHKVMRKTLMNENVTTYCLGTNGDGSPKHPLYVAYDTPLEQYPPTTRGD